MDTEPEEPWWQSILALICTLGFGVIWVLLIAAVAALVRHG